MCHTRELAFQISKEYERFSKYLPGVKSGVFFGGMPIKTDEDKLKNNTPHIVVGTPGRILALGRSGVLKLRNVKYFILDECDKMIGDVGKWKKYFQFYSIFIFTVAKADFLSKFSPKNFLDFCKTILLGGFYVRNRFSDLELAQKYGFLLIQGSDYTKNRKILFFVFSF